MLNKVKKADGYLVVLLNKVKPNKYNPKKDFKKDLGNKRMYDKVKDSIKVHKQIDPIIVRELNNGNYEIINGYHRYEAMKELKYKEIEVKNLGKMTREQAIAKALSTEYPRIPLDEIEVAQLVKEFVDNNYEIAELPYSAEEIDEKIELLDFDWENFDGDSSNLESLKDNQKTREVVCPECGRKFNV